MEPVTIPSLSMSLVGLPDTALRLTPLEYIYSRNNIPFAGGVDLIPILAVPQFARVLVLAGFAAIVLAVWADAVPVIIDGANAVTIPKKATVGKGFAICKGVY